MKECLLCQKQFDPEQDLTDPAQLTGQLLAEEDYGDAGQLCPDCLASRGRLAMMYRSDCFD
ncbi:hypothetical protein [Malonomonas rubra]|uniref:hypothetical protein n=1 Tax=Malonomonas rubra TaxID=57040 RepID=UPI0026EBAAF8|nr:hypothetical protein [Malonomonas rubra]